MRRLSGCVVVVAALVATACGSDKKIVGVVLPQTGVNKGYGASLQAGIKLALDDAIATKKPEGIEAQYRDSLSHPEYAAKETGELFKAGALIVIGGATTAEAMAMIPEAEKAQRVIISPSASKPGLAESSNLFFRTVPSDDVEAEVAAYFLVTHKRAKTVLVLFQHGLYSEGLLPVFTAEVAKLGAKVTDKLPIGPTDWDKAISDSLTASKPDAIFVCAYGEETLAALGVIRGAKFAGSVCATSAIDAGNVVKRAGDLAEGVFVPLVRLDLSSQQEPMKTFVSEFRAANKGAGPDLFAAYGYDAALAALYALEGPPPKDPSELLVRLMSLGEQRGVTGRLKFDKSGNITHHPRMHVIKGGAFEDCEPVPIS